MKTEKFIFYTLLMIVFSNVFALLAPITFGLLKGAFMFSDVLSTYNFYLPILFGSELVIITCTVIFYFMTKDDNKFGNGNAYATMGENPSPRFFKRFTYIQLAFIFLIIFLSLYSLAFFSTGKQQSYTGINLISQREQFTAVDDIVFQTMVVTTTENTLLGAVICLFLLALRFLGKKYNWNKNTFIFIVIIGTIILGFVLGGIWHSSVYANSQTALLSTSSFWAFGAGLIITTGNFLVFLMLHIVNNFFIDISTKFGEATTKIVMVVSLIASIFSYILIYRKHPFGDKIRLQEPETVNY